MVNSAFKSESMLTEKSEEESLFKHTSVPIKEVVQGDCRIDARAFGIEGRQARKTIENCNHPTAFLTGESGLAVAYYRPRFKRIYVERSDYPIYQPSQINEIHPKPLLYLSGLQQPYAEALRVIKGQVLLTRSGTIGNCTYVSQTLNQKIFSDDLIRIESKECPGYLYAFLKSKIGSIILNTNTYGAVVSHIEPKHLNNIVVPNPPLKSKKEIHDLIEKSFRLRDESNDLMDAAQLQLKQELKFPSIEKMKDAVKKFNLDVDLLNYSIPLGDLNNRLDGSYHVPLVDVIEKHIQKHAREVANIGDDHISQSIILPGRFKRIYVEEKNGAVFFGGKQMLELDPSNKKYLSVRLHGNRISENLNIHTNSTLLTRSGTIGKVAIVPDHWDNWIPNDHIIRVVPANRSIAGYLYAWLSSDYAYPLIARNTYGAVVDEIDDEQVSAIKIPLCHSQNVQERINDTILAANKKRAKAYELEQEALAVLNDKVIYA